MKKNYTLLASLFISLFSLTSVAQYAELDASFGSGGVARDPDGINDLNYCLALGGDESVYVGGQIKITDASSTSKFVVTKYTPTGELDLQFGANGRLIGFQDVGDNEVGDVYVLKNNQLYVLVNSFYSGGTLYIRHTLHKFNRDGTHDTNFNSAGTPGYIDLDATATPFYNNNRYVKLLVDETSGSIYIGGSSNNNFRVHKVNADGSKDVTFGASGTYTAAVATGNLMDMKFTPEGNIIMVGGQGDNFAGQIDNRGFLTTTSFGSGTGYVSIPAAGAYTDQSSCVTVQDDGKILIGGYADKSNYNSDFAIIRLEKNGTLDFAFGTGGTGIRRIDAAPGKESFVKKIFLQPDGKIILTGVVKDPALPTASPTAVIMRLNSNGSTDNIIPNDTIYSPGAVDIKGGSLYNGGVFLASGYLNATPDDAQVIKVKLFQPEVYGIFGKDYISINKTATFTVDPVKAGYTYVWSYSSDSVFFLGQAIGSSVTINFAEFSPSGTLSCKVYDKSGSFVTGLDKFIEVNQNPSLADLLEELTCPRKGIVCDSNYINRVHILKTNIDNNNTGCDNKSGGYKDYTFSNFTDTLFLGDRYSIEITCGGTYSTGNYAGLWIDFNNDGDFDDASEYKGSYFSTTNVITVSNFIIDNNVDFDGPKRLRVRMRHASEFKASESCPTFAENGEVEDYLILVDNHQKLQSTNFITPNDDGQNDYFVIRGLDTPSNEEGVSNDLKIYNRFGEEVYSATNYANNFKGISDSGETLKNGTYYFVLTQTYKIADEEQEDFLKGFFELKR